MTRMSSTTPGCAAYTGSRRACRSCWPLSLRQCPGTSTAASCDSPRGPGRQHRELASPANGELGNGRTRGRYQEADRRTTYAGNAATHALDRDGVAGAVSGHEGSLQASPDEGNELRLPAERHPQLARFPCQVTDAEHVPVRL